MIHVRRLRPGEGMLLRELRISALRDAPNAFGRTLAETLARSDADWADMERSVTEPGRNVMFVAEESEKPVGLVFGIRKEGGVADLAGMWVDPRARALGVGADLGRSVIEWARSERFETLVLWVTVGNVAARMLYDRLGFTATGKRERLASNGAREVEEMQLALRPGRGRA